MLFAFGGKAIADAALEGARAIASVPGFEPGADLTGPPMADGRGLHRGTIMDVPYGAGVLGSGDRGAYEDEHGTIHWGSGELEGDWSPGEGGTSADAIYTYGSDGHLDPSLKPSGTTRTETRPEVVLVDPGPSGGIRGTYTPGTPYRYPYLIPSRYDFSGPAGMPYTRAYWEDAGLPMGLLSYEYPGTYGSGTGGILGSGGSVYRPPVDTGGGFGTGTGTGTGTGSPETGTLPTDGRTGDGKTGDGKPETDFERHYPDDRGHDVHRTSPIYDDRDFLGDARRSAERTSVLLSPYWDGPGDGLVDHLGETVPDYTGYSDAVSAGLAEPRRLDGPPLPPSTVSRSEPAPLTADAERMVEADRIARASEAARKSEMDRRAEEGEAYKRLMAIVEAEEKAKDADMKAKAADAALRAEADRRAAEAAEAAERRAKAAEEERKKRVEALSFLPGRPVPPTMAPTTAGHTTAWEGGRHGGSVTRDASGDVVSSFSSDFASDDFMAGTGPPSVSAEEGWSPGGGWGGDAGGH